MTVEEAIQRAVDLARRKYLGTRMPYTSDGILALIQGKLAAVGINPAIVSVNMIHDSVDVVIDQQIFEEEKLKHDSIEWPKYRVPVAARIDAVAGWTEPVPVKKLNNDEFAAHFARKRTAAAHVARVVEWAVPPPDIEDTAFNDMPFFYESSAQKPQFHGTKKDEIKAFHLLPQIDVLADQLVVALGALGVNAGVKELWAYTGWARFRMKVWTSKIKLTLRVAISSSSVPPLKWLLYSGFEEPRSGHPFRLDLDVQEGTGSITALLEDVERRLRAK